MREKIISYVKNQINVDLQKYRTDFSQKWERENEIIVEYKEIPKTIWRNIELLANSKNSKIRIESVGVCWKMIAYR